MKSVRFAKVGAIITLIMCATACTGNDSEEPTPDASLTPLATTTAGEPSPGGTASPDATSPSGSGTPAATTTSPVQPTPTPTPAEGTPIPFATPTTPPGVSTTAPHIPGSPDTPAMILATVANDGQQPDDDAIDYMAGLLDDLQQVCPGDNRAYIANFVLGALQQITIAGLDATIEQVVAGVTAEAALLDPGISCAFAATNYYQGAIESGQP